MQKSVIQTVWNISYIDNSVDFKIILLFFTPTEESGHLITFQFNIRILTPACSLCLICMKNSKISYKHICVPINKVNTNIPGKRHS